LENRSEDYFVSSLLAKTPVPSVGEALEKLPVKSMKASRSFSRRFTSIKEK
jgi:hypothetical protein